MTKELTEEQKIERRAKAKAWREKNKDKIREYKKRTLAKPEVKEKQLQYVRNWRKKIKESGGNPNLRGNITPEQLKQYGKNYREKFKQKEKERYKAWAKNNRERLRENHKKWREANKEKVKEWREKNKDKISQWRKKNKKYVVRYIENKINELDSSYIIKNQEYFNSILPEQELKKREVLRRARKKYYNSEKGKRAYAKANKKLSEKIKSDPMLLKKKREEINRYHRVKRKTDPIFNLKVMVRNRLKMFLKTKKITKRNKTFDLIGCTPEELKTHIEKQFKPGMSWDNWGRNTWHIDHAVPFGAANTMEDIEMLCHYSNLQPMWAKENIKKRDKL